MSRVGKFLIARPTVELGFFSHSVVFIYEESIDGVAGLALSVPSVYTLRDLAKYKKLDTVPDPHIIYRGGPIAPNAVMMLHTEDFNSSNTLYTGTGLNISSDDVMFEKMIHGNEPRQFRLVAGCSVWAPGQLDLEIERGFWLVSKLPYNIVFGLDGQAQWKAAVDHAGKEFVAQFF